MSKKPFPVQQLFQALSSGRLFWIDSALNQSQIGTRCPYLRGALYLYLFNLRLVDSIKPYIDEPMIARLDAILCRVPTDTSASQCHHDDSQLPPSDQDANDFEYGEPSSSGEKLFLLMVDAFENAYSLISDHRSLFKDEEGTNTKLARYFALRLKLHFGFDPPPDLAVTDKLDKLDEGFIFCSLAFNLLQKNDQHALARIDSLHHTYRLNGHITWLQCLAAKNNNHLDQAKAHWLNASYMNSFDHNLAEERTLLFGEKTALDSVAGIRMLRRPSLYGLEPTSVDESMLKGSAFSSIRRELKHRSQKLRSQHQRNAENQITKRLGKKKYSNLSIDNVSYASPEDFLRTFIFIVPAIDLFHTSLALSGVAHKTYVFENLSDLVSRSVSKLDAGWGESRDLQIVRDHAEFIRRIWRSYELGVYGTMPYSEITSLLNSLEHWDFIRQVWPKATRLLILPFGNADQLVKDLSLECDNETLCFSLESRNDLKKLARKLKLNSYQFKVFRSRYASWTRVLLQG